MADVPGKPTIPVLILLEAHSERDEAGPLTSPMGYVYAKWMKESGLDPRQHVVLPVLREATTLKRALVKGKEGGIPGLRYVQRGLYLAAKYEPDLHFLWRRIEELNPNVILACGDLAMWAVTRETSLKSARGRVTHGKIPGGEKVVPTYSPLQIMADYSLRPIFMADVGKAVRQSAFPEIVRPRRFIHIAESIEDIDAFEAEYLLPGQQVGVDIETKGRMITCIGFSSSIERALVIPFFDELKPDGNFWPTATLEFTAWQRVRSLLRRYASVGQNFQYDMQYLWREMGIPSPGFSDDTMLLHHALQPELQKGLGFLASIYTDELSWKGMHKIASSDRTAKKGDLE